jgi:hypothetical protein
MGIPRKGSRSVETDGKQYVYLVKETTIPDHADQKAITVVIQEDVEKPGRVLRASYFYGNSITPTLIQGLIREGRALGWHPADRGGAFNLPPDLSQGRYSEDDPSSYR